MKEETLEEAVKPPIGDFIIANATPRQGLDGAYYHYSEVCKLLKLQAKRMYSEEEVEKIAKELFFTMANCDKDIIHKESYFDNWFEQFKKK